jgi:hypothetical protein
MAFVGMCLMTIWNCWPLIFEAGSQERKRESLLPWIYCEVI